MVWLTKMTLNKFVLPTGESVYQDARGQPRQPQRWPTEFHYLDGGREQANATYFVCVNCLKAEPWRQCFVVSPMNIEESGDLLPDLVLDLVKGYMSPRLHDWVSQREGRGQDKAWWEVVSILSGSYDRNTVAGRVLEHMSSREEAVYGNPATHGVLFHVKARIGPIGYLGRPPEPKLSRNDTRRVRSVV